MIFTNHHTIATLDLRLSIRPHFGAMRNRNRRDRSSRRLLPVQDHAALRQTMGEHALYRRLLPDCCLVLTLSTIARHYRQYLADHCLRIGGIRRTDHEASYAAAEAYFQASFR